MEGRPVRVLMVDDSSSMRSIVRKILDGCRFPFDISEADDGIDAGFFDLLQDFFRLGKLRGQWLFNQQTQFAFDSGQDRFDVQVLERQDGTRPAKSWQFV